MASTTDFPLPAGARRGKGPRSKKAKRRRRLRAEIHEATLGHRKRRTTAPENQLPPAT